MHDWIIEGLPPQVLIHHKKMLGIYDGETTDQESMTNSNLTKSMPQDLGIGSSVHHSAIEDSREMDYVLHNNKVNIQENSLDEEAMTIVQEVELDKLGTQSDPKIDFYNQQAQLSENSEILPNAGYEQIVSNNLKK